MPSTKPILAATVAASLLLAAGAASAKDLCVHRQDGTILAILQGIKVPPKGKCRPVLGTHANGVSHGAVCRTTTGDVLRFALTTNIGAGIFSTPKVREHNFGLAYPAMDSGGGTQFTIDGGVQPSLSESSLSSLYAKYCTASPIL